MGVWRITSSDTADDDHFPKEKKKVTDTENAESKDRKEWEKDEEKMEKRFFSGIADHYGIYLPGCSWIRKGD